MKHYIGIDIGGTSIKGGIVRENGEIVIKSSIPMVAADGYKKTIEDIYGLCLSLLEKAKLSKSDISAMGIGCPGSIWSEKGYVSYSNNLYWKNVPIIKEFQKYWKLPAFVGNDANCAALGEVAFGSGKGYKNAIFVTLGTGVGTGIVIEGKILEGERGAGSEGGHIMLKLGGEKCTCGRRGCWEAYASATALIRDTKKAMGKYPDSLLATCAEEEGKVSARTAFEAAKRGDAVGAKLIKQYVKYVGCGLVDLTNVFRPDVLLIGGGVSNEGDYFIDMVQKYVSKNAYGGRKNPQAKVLRATLGNDAGMLGGVALALKNGF